ncbi:MAG: prepilin-type N-terminal cleavage/methylation domain-containing protein [Oscillatoria princeps RMCB-10]|jgi:type IV pilus assembly protein PilA|nr:prepilin-type N-terminal cleavage/methylation domain-containing protein [Oscillatoria princeps RMCB-10]
MKLHQNYALSIWLLCRWNKTQGLTLIEFLVVVFVIGILAAVALPSLLSQTPKRGPWVEARNNIGALNRAQQAYYIEKNAFAGSIEKLGIGIKDSTNYRYLTQKTDRVAFNYAIPKVPNIKSYVGAVWTETTESNGIKEKTTRAILCEAKEPGISISAKPVYENGGFVCPNSAVILGQ